MVGADCRSFSLLISDNEFGIAGVRQQISKASSVSLCESVIGVLSARKAIHSPILIFYKDGKAKVIITNSNFIKYLIFIGNNHIE